MEFSAVKFSIIFNDRDAVTETNTDEDTIESSAVKLNSMIAMLQQRKTQMESLLSSLQKGLNINITFGVLQCLTACCLNPPKPPGNLIFLVL